MAQVKYLVYALLLLVGSILAVTAGRIVLSVEPTGLLQNTCGVVDKYEPSNTDTAAATANPLGKVIFSQNCQTCHALDKILTGPALRGVTKRGPWGDRANLVKWVHNPGGFIPTTPYTKALQVEFGGQIMPSYPQLSDEEINAIFDYIEGSNGVMY